MNALVPALVTVTLHVLNPAHVSPPRLEVAEKIAALVYANAGVRVLWMNDERLPSTDAQAAESPGTSGLWVVLLRGERERRLMVEGHVRDDVLGFAPNDETGPRGRVAYVFFDRLFSSAAHRQYPSAWLLGEVIAHEVGHLLLPVNSHAEEGIMRAGMDLRIGPRPQFTKEQAALIQRRLAESQYAGWRQERLR